MKKTLPMIAVLAAFSGVAHAQSSVTLYGLVDTGLAFNSNAKGGRQYSAASGNLQGDRWGLRGTEDLGGGISAIFRLEGGFNIDNGTLGQGGALFGRKAYVGLSGPYGTVTLGRQYDPLGDYVGSFESANAEELVTGTEWGSIYGAHPGDMDNLDNSDRINNAIKYASRNYGGFTFGGMYSLGGKAGDFTSNQLFGVGAGYHNGSLSLGVAYEKAKDPNYSVFGTNPSANSPTSTSTLNMSSPVYSGFASAGAWQVISAGAAYRIGNATIGGVYSNVAFQNLGSEAGAGLNPKHLSGTASFNIGELNFAYLVTPALQLGAAYTYTRGSSVGSISGASYSQVNLGADYFLSKRSDLYLVGIYEHASGVDSTGKQAVAAIANLSNSSTDVQTAVVVGIRHKF
ncbi:porin [Paraburkholderia caffeinilytica]|uniref:porin n=1 Tax=Paraburkholderia caffeinilytica TaxID=1761016 RepID=UPI0038BC1A25